MRYGQLCDLFSWDHSHTGTVLRVESVYSWSRSSVLANLRFKKDCSFLDLLTELLPRLLSVRAETPAIRSYHQLSLHYPTLLTFFSAVTTTQDQYLGVWAATQQEISLLKLRPRSPYYLFLYQDLQLLPQLLHCIAARHSLV